MKVTTVKGVSISALSLGTVQLGLDYGINNSGGKPDLATSRSILDTAIGCGINTLDTAAAYGDSEEVIGKWLANKDKSEHPFIVTKIFGLDFSSLDALRACVKEKVELSKAHLGLDCLPVLMLHHFDEAIGHEEEIMTIFGELKESGDIIFSGTSAYSNDDYGSIAALGFDAVQIPLNIFDWGQIENGGLKKLSDAGMMIFVRSVYLQGLVFKDPDTLEPHMEFCRETLIKFRTLCKKYGLSPAELAISYVCGIEGVTSLVLGCETAEQVKANAELFEKAAILTDAQMAEIREAFISTDCRVLNPGLWNPKK